MHSRRIVSESDRLSEEMFSTFLRKFKDDSVGLWHYYRIIIQAVSSYVSLICVLPSILCIVFSVSCLLPAVSTFEEE